MEINAFRSMARRSPEPRRAVERPCPECGGREGLNQEVQRRGVDQCNGQILGAIYDSRAASDFKLLGLQQCMMVPSLSVMPDAHETMLRRAKLFGRNPYPGTQFYLTCHLIESICEKTCACEEHVCVCVRHARDTRGIFAAWSLSVGRSKALNSLMFPPRSVTNAHDPQLAVCARLRTRWTE